jgi:hypothetical protein
VSFFLRIHRAVFDPAFYREIETMETRSIIVHLVKLFLLSTLIAAAAQTFYLFDRDRGIAGPLQNMLRGIEIKNGTLVTERPVPSNLALDDIQAGSLGEKMGFSMVSVLLDTAPLPPDSLKSMFTILLGPKTATLFWITGPINVVPYSAIFGEHTAITFSESTVNEFLHRHVVLLFLWEWIVAGILFIGGFTLFTVVILSFAAFIFRMERVRPIAHFVRIACFASTPIPVGAILIAVSGTSVPGVWNILVIASFAVMFRGVMASDDRQQEQTREKDDHDA